jgi:asparagine synthase (glutamine-hydrolysing)
MARQSGRVITNTIGSGDKAYDERSLARQVASRFGTEHHEFEVQPQATDVIEGILAHLDEPLADPSVIPTWYVCQMARRNVTVALSGDGGDENFGGYTFRYAPHVAEAKLRRKLPVALRAPVFGTLASIWPRSRRLPRPLRLGTIFGNLALSDGGAYCEDLAWLKRDARSALYTAAFTEKLLGFEPREVVQPFYERGGGDALNRSQRADQQIYMADDVLVKVDRMSMAHALETRAPLLDHRIREFAARLPVELKLQGSQGKVLLRALARKRLPAAITAAPKRGFSINLAQWLRGELKEYARERILAASTLLTGNVEPVAVQQLWDEHQGGARDHSAVLWNLIVATAWSAQ